MFKNIVALIIGLLGTYLFTKLILISIQEKDSWKGK